MTEKLSVILIGAGNMGGALFSAWVGEGILDPARSALIDPNPSDRILDLCEEGGIAINPEEDGNGYDIAVLAVKPQMFGDVLPGLDWPGIDKSMFVSIAAGTSIAEISALLKDKAPAARIVRTMPNLPSAIGEGMTLLTAGEDISDSDTAGVSALFEAAGEVVWTETEDQLDRFMGVTACAPAFVFLFAEALEAAALEQGANADDARLMAEQTLIGTALQLAEDGRSAEELRKAVTSPNGTTAAGLSVLLQDDALRNLMKEAVESAYRRARELAGS